MSAADPHTDDLADRLDEWAKWSRTNNCETPRSSDLRAAAAELRRLRQRDAALTRLLAAVGDADISHALVLFEESDGGQIVLSMRAQARLSTALRRLRRIAAAVEDIDREHER